MFVCSVRSRSSFRHFLTAMLVFSLKFHCIFFPREHLAENFGNTSRLVHVITWTTASARCQANQSWPSSLMHICATRTQWVNTLRPIQNGRHFPDGIFKMNFLSENVWISFKISLNFVPKGRQYSSIGSENGLPQTRRHPHNPNPWWLN